MKTLKAHTMMEMSIRTSVCVYAQQHGKSHLPTGFAFITATQSFPTSLLEGSASELDILRLCLHRK